MLYFRDCLIIFLKLFEHCRKENNLTWLVVNTCHRPPADTPTSISSCIDTCGEHQVDGVASASYGRWQGGATALLHQSCPVAVRDCQVVIGTGGITVLNSECSKLYGEDQPLLHLDRLGLLKVVRIVARIVGRGDYTCAKSLS